MLELEEMTKKQLSFELQKAEDSVNSGNVYTIEEVEVEIKKEFEI